VLKIEHPTRGDDTRQWGPPYAPHLDGRPGPGESAYYLSVLPSIFTLTPHANLYQVNRNKKSIGVSFKEQKGADLIRKLALNADVFVENYLPGTFKKYGLDFKTLSEANPKLIYASVTGYGQFGPYSNRAGYDVMVEA
jgi:succinate--hydroxymethylglutarate CoA-transferase